MSTSWSEDRVATLSKLWLGGVSASGIAKRLGGGVTRNAVIGKVHRLGLGGRQPSSVTVRKIHPPSQKPARFTRVAASGSRLVRAPTESVPTASPLSAPGLVVDMRHLGAQACKWPIGDPKADGFSFCGRHAEGRYCEAHEQMGVRPGSAWRPDRDPVVRRAMAGMI